MNLGLLALIVCLSIPVVQNVLSRNQASIGRHFCLPSYQMMWCWWLYEFWTVSFGFWTVIVVHIQSLHTNTDQSFYHCCCAHPKLKRQCWAVFASLLCTHRKFARQCCSVFVPLLLCTSKVYTCEWIKKSIGLCLWFLTSGNKKWNTCGSFVWFGCLNF